MAIKIIESAASSSHSNIDYIFISTLLAKDLHSTCIGSTIWKGLLKSCKQYFNPDSMALWNAPFTLYADPVLKSQDIALSSLSSLLHTEWQEYCLLFRSQCFWKESLHDHSSGAVRTCQNMSIWETGHERHMLPRPSNTEQWVIWMFECSASYPWTSQWR